jgi:signal transduction histidine kinase
MGTSLTSNLDRPARSNGTSPAPRPPWRWKRVWAGAFAAYTVFIILTSLQDAVFAARSGTPIRWHDLIVYRALEEYSCALFVPALFWLVHRFPIDRRRWLSNGSVLLLASVGFVVAKYALMRPLAVLVVQGWTDSVETLLISNLVSVLFDFWGVIAIAHAIEYYQRARDRERAALRLRAQLSRAQLDALQSQLHPHFLFNTLHAASTLMHRDVEGADAMLTQLADLLRATLRHPGTHEIPLYEEMALLDRYLSIMRARFRDRLTVQCDVAPDAAEALVPLFLLQPLVENALEHGVSRRAGAGRLELSATRRGQTLCICVADDGPGVSSAPAPGDGVGLGNTRARLEELYGDAQRLTLEAASASGGTRVVIEMPFRVRAGEAARAPAPVAEA